MVEKKVKETKKTKDDSKENLDFSDIDKNSQDGFLVGTIGSAAIQETPTFEQDFCDRGVSNCLPILNDTGGTLPLVSMVKLEINSPDGIIAEKDNETSSCIVCDKKFKSKSCMNKHLRSVHAGLYHNDHFLC